MRHFLFFSCSRRRARKTRRPDSDRRVDAPVPEGDAAAVWALLRLGAVLRPALLASRHTAGVERPAHDVVTHSGQVFYTAAADEHDRVFLEVVSFARDVA